MFHALLRRRTIDATPGRYPTVCVIEPVESRRMLAAAPFDAVLSDPEPPILGTEGARYVRRVGEDLALWATPDGSGAPYAILPLPLELTVGGTDGDDVVTIDMSGGDITLDQLTILASSGDDRIRMINGDGRVLSVNDMPRLNGKKLDVGVGDLRITETSVAAVESLIATARNAGDVRWQGPGIGTTAASKATGVAPIQQGADTLVKFTYNGDVNGDGRINADDYFRIDQQCPFLGSGCVLPTYVQGDLNFDDTFNADDYFLIDYAFLAQGEPLAGGGTAATDALPDSNDETVDSYRYLKRVGDELHAWSTPDGSGEPAAVYALPFVGDLRLAATSSDDVIIIDMSGGDIDILGALALEESAGDDVIRLTNGDGRLLTVGEVEPGGKRLDLGTADLRIVGGEIYAVEELVGAARNLGAVRWQGPGIGTSAAEVRTGLAPLREKFEVIVKYSYTGDMNGDGRINADDYFRIDKNFLLQPPKPLYEQGDLNFDDKIDADDYWIIDRGFLPPIEPWPPL